MKPSAIVKLLLGFGLVIIVGIILISTIHPPTALPPPVNPASLTKPLFPARLSAEIVTETFTAPDEVTEEYHLLLKITLWTASGEKITNPDGNLTLQLFRPTPTGLPLVATESANAAAGMIMTPFLTQTVNLKMLKVSEEGIIIHLKSGFKVAGRKEYLSLAAEYESINPVDQSPIRLRYDIPVYEY